MQTVYDIHKLIYFLTEAIIERRTDHTGYFSRPPINKPFYFSDSKQLAITDARLLVCVEKVHYVPEQIDHWLDHSSGFIRIKPLMTFPVDGYDYKAPTIDPPEFIINNRWETLGNIGHYDPDEDSMVNVVFNVDSKVGVEQSDQAGEPKLFEGVPFSQWYLWLVNQLPNVMFQKPELDSGLAFKFDYGFGKLMPQKLKEAKESAELAAGCTE